MYLAYSDVWVPSAVLRSASVLKRYPAAVNSQFGKSENVIMNIVVCSPVVRIVVTMPCGLEM